MCLEIILLRPLCIKYIVNLVFRNCFIRGAEVSLHSLVWGLDRFNWLDYPGVYTWAACLTRDLYNPVFRSGFEEVENFPWNKKFISIEFGIKSL